MPQRRHHPEVSAAEIVLLVVMLAGLVGVVVPVLPGLLLIFGAGVVWAFAEGGGLERWVVVLAMGVLAALGTLAPHALSGRRTGATGVPGWVLLAGVAGSIVGFFVLPVVGALAGFPAGVFVAELARVRDPHQAWRATIEALKGMGWGIAVQFAAGVAMIAVWAVGVWAT